MSETAKLEWKDAKSHREPNWPLMGYAPGKYVTSCRRCHERLWDVDKRAWHCLPCAIDEAKEVMNALQTRNAALLTENETLRAAISIVSDAG